MPSIHLSALLSPGLQSQTYVEVQLVRTLDSRCFSFILNNYKILCAPLSTFVSSTSVPRRLLLQTLDILPVVTFVLDSSLSLLLWILLRLIFLAFSTPIHLHLLTVKSVYLKHPLFSQPFLILAISRLFKPTHKARNIIYH
jgi:hypothetical protein